MKAEFLIDYCHQDDWQPQGGLRQSPIDIQTSLVQDNDETLATIQVNFSDKTATFFNNGQNLQLLGVGEATFNKRLFHFVQMHFHADSEHRINGKSFLILKAS